MSPELLLALAKSVPNLLVFVFLVVVLSKGQKAMAERMADQLVSYIKSRDSEFGVLIAQNSKVIAENSEALHDNTKVLGKAGV